MSAKSNEQATEHPVDEQQNQKPDGKRAACLTRSIDDMLSVFKYLTYEQFKRNFGKHLPQPLSKNDERQLEALFSQIIGDNFQDGVRKEILAGIESENILSLLNGLDDRIAYQRKYRQENGLKTICAWRPSGDPEDDTLVYFVHEYLQHKKELAEILKEAEQETGVLKKRVQEERLATTKEQKEIEKLIARFEKIKGGKMDEKNLKNVLDRLKEVL